MAFGWQSCHERILPEGFGRAASGIIEFGQARSKAWVTQAQQCHPVPPLTVSSQWPTTPRNLTNNTINNRNTNSAQKRQGHAANTQQRETRNQVAT